MASQRDILHRIRGARSTGKITRAMEMISAVKMRKAVERVMAIRPYGETALQVLGQLSLALEGKHPLLSARPVKRELYVVLTSNRGLCGAFNTQVLKKLREVLREDQDREPAFITLGRKGEHGVRRLGGNIIASFPETVAEPDVAKLRAVANIVLEEFQSGRVDRVVMVYTDFKSVMSQEVKVRALLPVTLKDSEKALGEAEPGRAPERLAAEYLFEPSPESVLERMIPRLIETELYHALLESKASEESARMLAMRNATDAAKEMVADYTLAYNQLRQQKITQEIAELSAGMAAVSGA
jgi:F-type H+-transporting ATPase subunit gamma